MHQKSSYLKIAICHINFLTPLTLSACLDWAKSCSFTLFFFFSTATFDFSTVNSTPVHCLRVSQITIFSNFFIKNEPHNTIYTFKNYFTTVFSVSAKISCMQTDPKGSSEYNWKLKNTVAKFFLNVWGLWVPWTIHGTHWCVEKVEKVKNCSYCSWTVAIIVGFVSPKKKKRHTQTPWVFQPNPNVTLALHNPSS